MQKEFEKIKEILKSPMGLKPFNKHWNTILFTDYSSKGIGFCLTLENLVNKEGVLLHQGLINQQDLPEKQKIHQTQ